MLGFLRRRAEYKRRVEQRADELIAAHGEDAWSIIYGKCRDLDQDEDSRAFHYRVRRVIERRLNIPPRVDTATRYLEPD
jgi:hypothetical protein